MTKQYNHDIEARSQKPEARSVEVYVATHKQINFALPDYCRKIQVNAQNTGQWEGYLHDNDNQSDNISLKNSSYCELTALYSMWKNCSADIQGLFHYRRFFSSMDNLSEQYMTPVASPASKIYKSSISRQAVINALEHENYDVILSLPFPPYPLNVQEDLKRFCYWKDIKEMLEVIKIYYPDYVKSLNEILASEHISYCNMFIAKREFVNSYCEWLFDVLAKLEQRVSLEGYDSQHKRIYGYIAEVLLNVYIHKHSKRCKYFYMQNVIELSPVKAVMFNIKQSIRKIHAVRKILRLLHKNPVVTRHINRYISLQKFLSGDHETQKFSQDIEANKLYMQSLGFESLNTFKEKNISYITAMLQYEGIYMDSALLIPDEPDKLNSAPFELLNRLEAQAVKQNRLFIPRIILSAKTPESVKESLIESGVRIYISD